MSPSIEDASVAQWYWLRTLNPRTCHLTVGHSKGLSWEPHLGNLQWWCSAGPGFLGFCKVTWRTSFSSSSLDSTTRVCLWLSSFAFLVQFVSCSLQFFASVLQLPNQFGTIIAVCITCCSTILIAVTDRTVIKPTIVCKWLCVWNIKKQITGDQSGYRATCDLTINHSVSTKSMLRPLIPCVPKQAEAACG